MYVLYTHITEQPSRVLDGHHIYAHTKVTLVMGCVNLLESSRESRGV